MSTPRPRSQRPSASATVVSTASLSVPPSAFLIALNSSTVASTHVYRRCGPIGTLSGDAGAGRQAGARHRADARRGPRRCAGPRRAARASRRWSARRPSAGTVARSISERGEQLRRPSARARATHARSGRGAAAAPARATVSNRTEVMSTPETPSTSAWWVFEMIAKRGEPSVGRSEALDEVHLPQRLRAVERRARTGARRSARARRRRPARAARCGGRGSAG